MPVVPVAGLSSSIASSATSVGSRLASPFASMLGQAASQGASPTTSAAASATSALQQQANAALDGFRKQFQALLIANQIDISQPIQLQSDGLGGVDVSADNPDAGHIKSLLQSRPDLVAQFASLNQQFAALRAADPTQSNSAQQNTKFGVTFSGQQATIAFS
jgi:hypothetical protein